MISRNKTTASQDQSLGWAGELDGPQSALAALDRADVLAEMRSFFSERDGFNGTDEELKDKFWSDRTWRNVNTVSMAKDVWDAHTMSDRQAGILARMQKLHDHLPNVFDEGGRGVEGLAQNIVAGVLDPINVIGGASGKAAGQAAMRTAKLAGASRSQVIRKGIVEGFKAGAKGEALAGAGVGAGQDVLMQSRNQEIGIQDGFSMTSLLGNAAFGGALGGAFGGTFGAVGAAAGDQIDAATGSFKKTMFGDATNKYAPPAEQDSPAGVDTDVTVDAQGKGASEQEIQDAKVQKYIAAQSDQYQRNLDAVIDQIREESGEVGLANWQSSRVDDASKTEAMRLADEMRDNRDSLKELYKWQKMRESYKQQRDALALQEKPKPEVINRINELEAIIERGDDAYSAIVRASGDGKERAFDEAIEAFARFKKNPNAVVMEADTGAVVATGTTPAVAANDGKLAALQRVQSIVNAEGFEKRGLNTKIVDDALASGDPAAVEAALQYTQAVTRDAGLGDDVRKIVDDAIGEEGASAADAPQSTLTDPEEIATSLSSMDKRYNALSNKLNRIKKSVEAGKATPDAEDRITSLVAERERLNIERAQLKERLTALTTQNEEPLVIQRPKMTIEAEAASSPLDAEGVGQFLSQYGFEPKAIRAELGEHLSKHRNTRAARTSAVRSFVAAKVRFARSAEILSEVMDVYTEAVALNPKVFEVMLGLEKDIPKDIRADVLTRYREWVDIQAPNIFSSYLAKNPMIGVDQILNMITVAHGEAMTDAVMRALDLEKAEPIIQAMASMREKASIGWEKLTKEQQDLINKKVEASRSAIAGSVKPVMLETILRLTKENLIVDALYEDFLASAKTAGTSPLARVSVIVDGSTTVTGKSMKDTPLMDQDGKLKEDYKFRTISKSDKRGVQGLLRKADQGRAIGIDENGDAYIEFPYFGNLFVRDIVRNKDGSVDYAKTVDNKYIVGKNGKMVRKTFDAAETARRAIEDAGIERATNRLLSSKKDVADIKKGERVTEKQLRAAEVEASRKSDGRTELNKRKIEGEVDNEAEALNKIVRKLTAKSAVRQAVETSEDPISAINKNIEEIKDQVPEMADLSQQEVDDAYAAVEAEDRAYSIERTREEAIARAMSNYDLHKDGEALYKELEQIRNTLTPQASKPKTHLDKPEGAKHTPRVYVFNGFEVDVRHHFKHVRSGDNSFNVYFLDTPVGSLIKNKDGSATVIFTTIDGLEQTNKASSLDVMADYYPRIFGDYITEAGEAGKLQRAADGGSGSVYPIDWKVSNTWGKVSKTVPVETVVEETTPIIGPVSDFKANLEVTASNLPIPEGHDLAVQILDGRLKGVVRVESTKGTTKQTIKNILGNQSEFPYTVGFVPKGTRSASTQAQRLFKPIDASDPVFSPGAEVKPSPSKQPVSLDKLVEIPISQDQLPVHLRNKGISTMAHLQRAIMEMEVAGWDKMSSIEQYSAFVSSMKDLYQLRATLAPNGIKYPNASRAKSMAQVTRIFKDEDPVVLSTALDILRRLSFNDRELPNFSDVSPDKSMSFYGAYTMPTSDASQPNQVFIDMAAIKGKDGNKVPPPVVMIHEIGHWAYTNILTDADRMEFWQSMGKYFTDGSLDMEAIQRRLPGLSRSEQHSPAEFFANQFAQWAVTRGKVNNIPLWTRMAKAITKVAQAFGVRLSGDRASISENLVDIDPELAELFTKIMPDTDPMYDRFARAHKIFSEAGKIQGDTGSKTAFVAAHTAVKLDYDRRLIDAAIENGDPSSIIEAVTAASNTMFGMFGGERGSYTHKKIPGKEGTGQRRNRILDGNNASTKEAYFTAIKAIYDWRDFLRQLPQEDYSAAQSKLSFDTEGLDNTESGDLGTTLGLTTEYLAKSLDEDAVSTVTMKAIEFSNRMARITDEMVSVINRVGNINGQPINIDLAGNITPKGEESNIAKRHRSNYHKKVRDAVQKAQEAAQNIDNIAASGADRDAIPSPKPEVAISSKATSEMSLAELTGEYRSLAGVTKDQPISLARKRDLEVELRTRVSAIPDMKITAPSDALMEASPSYIERQLFKAIRRNKTAEVEELMNALAWKKRDSLTKGILTPTSVRVDTAAKIIKDAVRIGTTDNGVPQNTTPQIQQTIKGINNRKRTDERNARVVTQRLLALLGKGGNVLTEDGVVTKGDIAKILGMPNTDDVSPVTEIDAEYDALRKAMREIGTDIKTQAGKTKALTNISRMTLNILTSQDEVRRLGTNLDEVNAAFVANMLSNGSIDDHFDYLPVSAREKLADMFKENMEAVQMVAGGLMKKSPVVQAMSLMGDALIALDNLTYKHLGSLGPLKGVHPSIAEAFKREHISNLPSVRRTVVESFTGADLEDSVLFSYANDGTNNYVVESKGAVIFEPTNGTHGKAVYLRKSVSSLEDADISTMAPGKDARDWQRANNRVNELSRRLSAEKANLEAMKARGENASDFISEVINPLTASLERAIGVDNSYMLSSPVRPRAVPAYVRAFNSARFSKADSYSVGSVSHNSADWLLAKLEADGLITSKEISSIGSIANINGEDLHSLITKMISSSKWVHADKAVEHFNTALKALGYDSIDTGNALAVFDNNNVRHIGDAAFNIEEVMNSNMAGVQGSRSLNGDLFLTMMAGDINREDTSNMVLTMQAMGAPAMLADPLKKLIKRKPVTLDDVQKVSWFAKMFSENSTRFRMSGANWFADKIKPSNGNGFYEKKDAEVGKALMVSKDADGKPISLMTKINQLPGRDNTAQRRWMNRNKFWGTVAQPIAHQRIVAALRRGDDAINALSKEEREVALDVRKFFENELNKARKSGLPMSYRKNYVTQIWDADAIKNDPTAFVTTMRDFFLREMQQGNAPTPAGKDPSLVAEEKAKTLMSTLTSEGSDGVLLPDNALRARLEDPFFERVINLSPEDLKAAERFMVNDLQGIVMKYADQVTTRRILTEEFGLGNHAVSAYLNTIVNGKAAVVDALRNTKTFAKERRAADASLDARVIETTEVISGVDGTEQEIAEAVDEAIKMLGATKREWQANKEKVKNFLLNLQDPAIVAAQPEFVKRIDAVVAALAEFGGKPSGIDGTEINAMTTMIAGMSKKPVDQGWTNTPSMMKFSRSMRTFNNISLLAFTTLASIPDLAMPLIRSGNFAAMQKVWTEQMFDPHYREMARNIGVGVESVLHERLAHMYADTSSRVSNSFFNMTFLNQWTNIQREAAALIGFESFKAEAKRAQDLLAKGMSNSKEYAKARRYLARYGLESYATPGARILGETDMANNDTLRYAIMRFTNEAIFAPNPNDIPLWAQNPVGMLVFQLKSYPLMMSRMSAYCVSEFRAGNPAPIGYLLAAGGMLGSTSLAIRDVAQGRGDTDGDGKTDALFRERYASEGMLSGAVMRWYNSVAADLGLDVEDGGNLDMVLGWFCESMLVAGGFGLFADLMHTAVEQSDNRDYGKMRMMGWMLGPSFSVAGDAIGVTQAAAESIFSDEPSNSTRRAAVRSVAQRVPVLGAIKPFRETVTDIFPAETSGGSEEPQW